VTECQTFNEENVKFKFNISKIDEFLPFLSVALPPERAPSGKDPVGVNPLSWRTLSLSSLKDKLKIAIDQNEMKRMKGTEEIPQNGEDTGHFADGSNFVANHFFTDGSCFPLQRT
jgi:hypothetical protein